MNHVIEQRSRSDGRSENNNQRDALGAVEDALTEVVVWRLERAIGDLADQYGRKLFSLAIFSLALMSFIIVSGYHLLFHALTFAVANVSQLPRGAWAPMIAHGAILFGSSVVVLTLFYARGPRGLRSTGMSLKPLSGGKRAESANSPSAETPER